MSTYTCPGCKAKLKSPSGLFVCVRCDRSYPVWREREARFSAPIIDGETAERNMQSQQAIGGQ